jgi:hypothetical protein
MNETHDKIDANFFQLVLSLQMAAMQQMGKIASPISGKVERNLTQAKASIDMLNMLSEKTQNNLTDDEKGLLDRILFELRMNYVDESKKPDESAETPDTTEKDEASMNEGGDKKESDDTDDSENVKKDGE